MSRSQELRFPRLVGLSGRAGSGKDTAADILFRLKGYLPLSFATPIKRVLATLLNESLGRLEDREWRERPLPWLGRSPRYLMQTLGTEWGRNLVHPDFWVLCMERDLDSRAEDEHHVITDVRFPNEAAMIKRRGGLVIKLIRDVEGTRLHESEDSVDLVKADVVISNDGTIDDLRDKLREALLAVSRNEKTRSSVYTGDLDDYRPKTELGRQLLELRRQYLEAGGRVLTWDELDS